MKPITHPLAIAYCERANADSHERFPAYEAWRTAGFPLYADPTPLPAPALGMRIWIRDPATGITVGEVLHRREINTWWPGMTWEDCVPDTGRIDVITDIRKGDIVLWERQ